MKRFAFPLLGLITGTILGILATNVLPFTKPLGSSLKTIATPDTPTGTVSDLGTTSKDVKTLGVLLLGYGGDGHDGGYLTDAIQVLYIDFEKNSVNLISIPRDLSVKQANGKETKINASIISSGSGKGKDLMSSGAKEMKKLVSGITGLPIDYFAAIDFVGYQRLVGIVLSGVEVEVHELLDDPFYPIKGEELNLCGKSPEEVATLSATLKGFELEKQFKCRYRHLHFVPGKTVMQGDDALAYVRSRHGSAAGDVSRGKRQQEVLAAIKGKLFSLSALSDIPKFYDTVTKHVVTDATLDSLKYLGPLLSKANDFKITQINLGPENVLQSATGTGGAYIMVPKAGTNSWSSVQNYLKENLGK